MNVSRKTNWNRFKTLIKLGASLGIIAYLIQRFHFHLSTVHINHPLYLGFVTLLLFVQPLFSVIRWHWLLNCFGHTLSYARLTGIFFISLFLNQFLPASVGGDALRIWYGRKAGAPLAAIVASVLMDRVCALLGLLLMIGAALPFADRVISDRSVVTCLWILVAAGVGGIIVLALMRPWTRLPKSNRMMAIFSFPTNSFYQLCAQPSTIVGALVLSVIIHTMTTLGLYGVVLAVGEHLSILQGAVLIPPIIIAQMIPISIGGWGVREVAAVAALTSAGLDPTQSLAISLIFGLLNAIASTPGALIWILQHRQTQLIENALNLS